MKFNRSNLEDTKVLEDSYSWYSISRIEYL